MSHARAGEASLSIDLLAGIGDTVRLALTEDIGSGDITAGLVNPEIQAKASVVAREQAVICGRPWFDEVFRQLCPSAIIEWQVSEGDQVSENQCLVNIRGQARALLTAERSALNFLQALSGTASLTAQYVAAVAASQTRIVDTRKTIPGLRNAQKYAVLQGGGHNHRIGLFDGILIKENHIAAAGGIAKAIQQARALNSLVPLMTEAETLEEAAVALSEDVDLLLVDEFSAEMLIQAVRMTRAHRAQGGKTLIEYSGSAQLANIAQLASSGVDRISVGSLTKHIRAIDLSMRFE